MSIVQNDIMSEIKTLSSLHRLLSSSSAAAVRFYQPLFVCRRTTGSICSFYMWRIYISLLVIAGAAGVAVGHPIDTVKVDTL